MQPLWKPARSASKIKNRAAVGLTDSASRFYLKKRLTEKGICIHLPSAASPTRGKTWKQPRVSRNKQQQWPKKGGNTHYIHRGPW